MRILTISSHILTGVNSFKPGSDVRSWNHGRAGEVMPDIMPDANVRTASVAVLSTILELRRSPRLRSVTTKRDCRGRM